MRVRCVFIASVSSAFLAASVAVAGTAFATEASQGSSQAVEAANAMAAGDQELAIANYTAAIDSGTLSVEEMSSALLGRGLAYQQAGKLQQAIADYSLGLKQSGLTSEQAATARYNRGLAQHKLGNTSAAVDDFTAALYAKPDFAQAYYSRGNALRESGQNLFALSDYEKALRHKHPDPARVYLAESQAYEALKRPDDARKAKELSLAAAPSASAPAVNVATAAPGKPVAADPLLTASNVPVGGEVTIKKPDLPKAVEPPAALAPVEAPSKAAKVVVPEAKPSVVAARLEKPKKKYLDRIPQGDTVAQAAPAEKVVAVEPVDTTASIEPAAAPPATAVEAPSASPAASGWNVQVASAVSEDAAWSTFKKMQAKKRVLEGKTPVVVKADLGSKGTFYRVRFAYDDQKEAQKACAKLKAGGVSCYVSR